MDDRSIKIYLIGEDIAHETIVRSLFRRVAFEECVKISISKAITGGYGKVITEIKGFQRALFKGIIPAGSPDLLLVMGDANCGNFRERKKEIMGNIDPNIFPFFIVGCPDPHIEKWLLIDDQALLSIFGSSTNMPLDKCIRDYYKNELKRIIRSAGWPIAQEGLEYSQDIINIIDFARAEKNDQSFKIFISDLRSALKKIKISFRL